MNMNGRLRNSLLTTLAAAALIVVAGAATDAAHAQSVIPDEAVKTGGVVGETALSPMQKTAIYHAVARQGLTTSTAGIADTVGAAVPAGAELRDLPYQQDAEDNTATILKYAMVEGKVVVIDPIAMRVIDIIGDGARP